MSGTGSHPDWGEAFGTVVAAFVEAGLVVPPIPQELRPNLRRLAPWVWATRPVRRAAMYLFGIEDLLTSPVAEYVAISYGGHGMNSYAITYHLVWGPLAVFTQDGWGGVYMDPIESRLTLAETFTRTRQLAEAAQRHRREPTAGGMPRLVVVWSSLRGMCGYGLLRGPVDSAGPTSHSAGPTSHPKSSVGSTPRRSDLQDCDGIAELFNQATETLELLI